MIGHYDGETYTSFHSLLDFINHIVGHSHNLIFCHFGGVYDFQFILQEILKSEIENDYPNSLSYSVENLIPRGSGILCFDLVLRTEGQETRRIKFSDSGALLPYRLDSLTRDFNVKHKKLTGSIDFKRLKKVTPELLKYNENDCKGLWEVLHKFYQSDLVKKSGMALTTAGQSMQLFRTYLKEPIYSLPKKVDEFVRTGYLGGRVEIFKPYYPEQKDPLYQYDVNSIYPYVMRNSEIPGEVLHRVDYFDAKEMQMIRAKVFVPRKTFIPFLGTRHKGKLIFPVGTFTGVWTSIELAYAKTLGVKILKVYEGYSFRNRGFIFQEFIDDLWKIRAESETDSVNNFLSKLLMNSNYGRHGLRIERENLVFDEFEGKLEEYQEIKAGKHTVQVSKKKVTLNSYSNVVISAWITAGARIHMHKLFGQIGWNIYYTDTDCLFTPEKMPISKELGGLKLEDTIKAACFLLPKTYCYELLKPKKLKDGKIRRKKVVMKGFDRKKIQRFTFEDFRLGLSGDLSRLKTGVPPKFARLRTAMKKGGLLYLTDRSTRQVKSLYDKRRMVKIDNQWSTKPLILRVIKKDKQNGKTNGTGIHT